VQRPLFCHSWCRGSCRPFRRCWRHSRCGGHFATVLGAKTPVGCFADLGATRGAKTSLPPFLVRKLLSVVSQTLAPLAVRRLLYRRSWCEDSCRLFHRVNGSSAFTTRDVFFCGLILSVSPSIARYFPQQ
jgi:hypothetical protein